jgi:hypothetical protein
MGCLDFGDAMTNVTDDDNTLTRRQRITLRTA